MSPNGSSGQRVVVTGGAGFIGSHLVDALVARGDQVTVIDDLSAGSTQFLADARDKIDIVVADASVPSVLDDLLPGADAVWHLAANPEVRTGATEPGAHFDRNVRMTWEVLEAVRRHNVPRLHFTSTSTVYGTATVMPTPEHYGPLLPISVYGGCKLACEGLVSAHAATFGFDALLYRFANVVGPRSNHGVTYDFVQKLKATPERLEILGDGTQSKSYVHVSDTIAGMLAADATHQSGVDAYNIGSLDSIPVTAVADQVAAALGLAPEYVFKGGTSGGAGWKGDVKHMGLSVDKLRALGWEPKLDSARAIHDTAAWLAEHAPHT